MRSVLFLRAPGVLVLCETMSVCHVWKLGQTCMLELMLENVEFFLPPDRIILLPPRYIPTSSEIVLDREELFSL